MTNLIAILASVVTSLSTNVTTTDNSVYERVPIPCTCPPKPPGQMFTLEYHSHGYHNGALITAATEKTETEIVARQWWEVIPKHFVNATDGITNCFVDIEESRKLVKERELSRISRTYKLDQNWRLSDTRTNEPPLVNRGGVYITNHTPWLRLHTNIVITNNLWRYD